MSNKLGFVVLGIALGSLLSACSSVPSAVNPISWYRDITGASKNDNLGKGENEQNLQEGDNEPYPNLGSVPNAPDTQLSGVDRDKLVNSLVADRSNAQYSADNLRAGEVASTVPPPAPPAAPAANSSSATVGGASSAARPSAAPTTPIASSPVASAPAPTAPAPTASAKSASSPAASGGNGATKTASSNGLSSSAKKPPPRGSEAPPPESSLRSPTIPNVPQGEAATPPPPLPNIPPPNATASAAPTPKSAAPAPGAAAPKLTKPATPAPTQQATEPADVPPATALHRPAISYRVADVSFARGSAAISDGTRNTIAEIVKLHNEDGGMIRVIGHGEATGKDAAMAGFTLALDRAQAVAVALADAGVDAKDIAVETAPVAAKGGADAPRAEVYLEH